MDALPEVFRIVVVLTQLEGFSYDEVAKMLRVPIGTIRSRLARGRGLLQKSLWQHAREAGWIPNGTGESTEQDGVKRKLTAILYADVVGYSRLTREDETVTHHVLSTYLDTLTTTIKKYNGVVQHFAGDAVLADFDSVQTALACAVDIQRDLTAWNSEVPDNRKVVFRIGLNMGDVIVDRNDIYGDGVNIAARLEDLADPGGVCISGTVYDAVGGKLPFEYEFIGEQSVKNIDTPVRAYRVVLDASATDAETNGSEF